ncbi:MAG: chemotaxis protein CheD [bacterium]|nr:chemotaxis protein CheD [bacterium]
MGKLVVSIADLKVSTNPEDTIITYALGSCLGLTIYDPVAKVAGMLHAMLADSSLMRHKPEINPYKFVNTGIPALFKAAYKLGAKKSSIQVKMAGCSSIMDDNGVFNIGKRNYAATRKILWKNNVMIEAEHCRKSDSITLSINVGTGEVSMKISNKIYSL